VADVKAPGGAHAAQHSFLVFHARCFSWNAGLCSARLQAGMCLDSKCPPEGGRYKTIAASRAPAMQRRGHAANA
jgi:hypothetical protein